MARLLLTKFGTQFGYVLETTERVQIYNNHQAQHFVKYKQRYISKTVL